MCNDALRKDLKAKGKVRAQKHGYLQLKWNIINSLLQFQIRNAASRNYNIPYQVHQLKSSIAIANFTIRFLSASYGRQLLIVFEPFILAGVFSHCIPRTALTCSLVVFPLPSDRSATKNTNSAAVVAAFRSVGRWLCCAVPAPGGAMNSSSGGGDWRSRARGARTTERRLRAVLTR
jgi:hypothetical protein